MSDFQYVYENSGVMKNTPESETGPQKATQPDPNAVLNTPQGPGQLTVRAQAINQLQKTHGNQHVQRVVSGINDDQQMDNLAREVDSRRGYGQSINDQARSKMESTLNQDFSNVRVHTDSKADALSRNFGARAFTTGQDIFFKSGAYDPGSSSGDKLLAHELTHVVQQGNAPAQLSGSKMNISKPGDAGEQEANRISESLNSSSEVSQEKEETVQKTVQLQEEEELQTQVEEEEEIVQEQEEEEELQTQAEEEEEIQTQSEEEEIQTQTEEEEIQTQSEEEEEVQPQAEEEESTELQAF